MHSETNFTTLPLPRGPGESQRAPSESASVDWQSVLPIGVDTLCAADLLDFDLYLRQGTKQSLTLYRRRTSPLTQEDLKGLCDRGVRTLYISSLEASAYRDYLRERVMANESIPPAQRFQALREATRAVFLESVENRNADKAVAITDDLGHQMVETICRSDVTLRDLLQVMSHDYGAFAHAVNVATYCLVLGRALGIRDEGELLRIGQGALIHDIGNHYVPVRVLEKRGRLDHIERQTVMQHPVFGFRELCHREDLTWGQLMMVYQHHERCDGRGYPSALVRHEIHEHARLCSIADVCDALMRDRPYRKASLKGDVVEYLDRQAGRGFDEEMTRCWIATILEQS